MYHCVVRYSLQEDMLRMVQYLPTLSFCFERERERDGGRENLFSVLIKGIFLVEV